MNFFVLGIRPSLPEAKQWLFPVVQDQLHPVLGWQTLQSLLGSYLGMLFSLLRPLYPNADLILWFFP